MVKPIRAGWPATGSHTFFRGRVLIACLLTCLTVSNALAQLPGYPLGQESGAQKTHPAVATLDSDNRQLLEAIRQKLNDAKVRYQNVSTVLAGKNPPSYASFEELSAQQIQLFRTRTALESWLTSLGNLPKVQLAVSDLESKIQSWSGFGIEAPYPVSFVDQLSAEIRSKHLELQTEQAQTALEEDQIPSFRKAVEQAGSKARKVAEDLEKANEKNEARLRWLMESASDEQAMAEASLQSVLAKVELNKQQASLLEREIDFLKEKQKQTYGKTKFSREELDARLKDITKQRELLKKKLEEVENQSNLAQEQATQTRTRLEQELAGEKADQARFRKLLELRQVEAGTASQRVETLKLLLAINSLETILWQERFRVYESLDKGQDFSEAINNIVTWQKRIKEFNDYYSSKALLIRTQIQTQNETLKNWSKQQPGELIEQAKLEAYKARMDDLEQVTASLETISFLTDRLRAESSAENDHRSLAERLQISLLGSLNKISKIWDYEIFTVDDTIIAEGRVISDSRPVTLKKLISGLLLLVIGIWLVGKISKLLSHQAQQRLKVERSLIMLFEKIGQYLAIFIVIVAALGLVRIPLTAFAFLGGALAIGVGFGGQNLINNFMSSLILLIEKPIKVGDLVEIENVLGRVTTIGGRCSTIRRFDGVDLLVPNSHLLEKTVVNRTLADKFVRYAINVGVAYGSPTRDVFRILEQVVDEHGLVLKDPKPVVVLEDFAADALLFGIYYWIEVNEKLDARVTASDLRHRIDRLFRDAGISIAFPQRDVHLDAANPLKVQLIAEQQPKDESAKV